MNSLDNKWRRTALSDRGAYRSSSRNGAVAIWLGITILLGLFYSSLFTLIVNWIWGA